MQPGFSNPASVTAILRRFAYNRACGALELEGKGRSFAVVVVHGRIAAVEDGGWSLVEEVRQRLIAAGRIPSDTSSRAETIDQLFHELETARSMPAPVDEVFFRRVVRETVLDKLLSLHLPDASHRGNGALRGDISPRFSPAIDIEDLRFDADTLPELSRRFNAVFPLGAQIVGARCAPHRFSTLEQVILSLIAEPTGVTEVYRRALLSRVRFYEVLLGLYERGVVTVVQPDVSETRGEVAQVMSSIIDASVEVEVVARDLSAAAIAHGAETTILQSGLGPRALISLWRRLTGA